MRGYAGDGNLWPDAGMPCSNEPQPVLIICFFLGAEPTQMGHAKPIGILQPGTERPVQTYMGGPDQPGHQYQRFTPGMTAG